MKFSKQLFTLLSIASMGGLVLTGCSDDNSDEGNSDKQKLTWWTHEEETFVNSYQGFADEFMDENPNVEIEIQRYPYDDYVQKIQTAFTTESGPDIAEVFGGWALDYADKGVLDEVPEEIATDIYDNYYEPTYGSYLYEDKLYGIPFEYNIESGLMLVNSDMFAEENLDYPETWNDFVSASEKLTDSENGTINIKGFDFTSGDNVTYMFLAMILQQDGKYLTEDGNVDFTSPEAIEAMTELKNFVTEYKVTDLTMFGGGEEEPQDLFFKEKAAMVNRGPWAIPLGIDVYEFDEDKFDYVKIPSFTDSDPYFAAESGWGQVVASYSEEQDLAWEFIDFMTETERAESFNVNTYTIPAKIPAAEDPKFVENVPTLAPALDILEYGQYLGRINPDFLKENINNIYQEIASDSMTVEEGLGKLENQINESL